MATKISLIILINRMSQWLPALPEIEQEDGRIRKRSKMALGLPDLPFVPFRRVMDLQTDTQSLFTK